MCLVVEDFVCLMMMFIGEMNDRNGRQSYAPDNVEYVNGEARTSYFNEIV